MPTHFQGNKETVRALNAFINLARASDSLFARTGKHVESHGMTAGQFGALEALLHLGPMCQRELGEKLLRSGGNITLVVDNLEKQGWVRRERQKDDRRMIRIHLTPRGRQLIARVFPKHALVIVKEMSRLSAREQEELRRICRKLGVDGEKVSSEKSQKEREHVGNSTE
jgi:MarR family transcriptional regulator, 2-MHQ and catechol-resistance regulon repressor